MEDVKDKMKGLMKKMNNPFSSSSSSSKFKGQGRILGSSSSSPSSAPPLRPSNTAKPPPNPPIPRSTEPKPPSTAGGFDPFSPFISNTRKAEDGISGDPGFECPVCAEPFPSEEEVSAHVEACLRVGDFLSGGPKRESVEVVIKLLRNIVREPENSKFRRIRMGNPKIKEAVGDVAGGVEMLERLGFGLREEEGEVWAVMEAPSEEGVAVIRDGVLLLEQSLKEESSSSSDLVVERPREQRKIDRQVRVFFSVPESVASKIDLPDSFYNRSSEELRKEAELRRKKIAESQLLIPKSYKERQAKAYRKRYKATIIRIQFPDGVVLQGVFLPSEPTTGLYEFVSSSLKEPSLEFELLRPGFSQRRLIPRFPVLATKHQHSRKKIWSHQPL
ncbi:hypothetical protein QJS10_CPA06g02222 [Acorus calamus]|uniref:UBX domain-containing protein n=1 Tax=Acorus calamus TaxID=4465 RepID=A0AAV9EN40_ACOCL|nr:hypothetical protein QJS10_CPA06g02222 [Acorus calamus]